MESHVIAHIGGTGNVHACHKVLQDSYRGAVAGSVAESAKCQTAA